MSGCDCSKAKAELEEFLHDELCREDAADIREHMESCEDCTSEHRVGVVLMETVKRACKETAPDQLRTEILARIRVEQASPLRPTAGRAGPGPFSVPRRGAR